MEIPTLMQQASGLMAAGQLDAALSLLSTALAEGGAQMPYLVGEQVAKLAQQLGDTRSAAALWDYLYARASAREDRRGRLHAALGRVRSRLGQGKHEEARLLWLACVVEVDPEHSTPAELVARAEGTLAGLSADARTLGRCEAARTLALYFGSSGRFGPARSALDLARSAARAASDRVRPWTHADESALYAAELEVDAGQLAAAEVVPSGVDAELAVRWRLLQIRALTLAGDYTRARSLAQTLRAESADSRLAEQASFALAWTLVALNRLGDLLALTDEVSQTYSDADPRRQRFEQLHALGRMKARIAERDEPLAFVPEQVLEIASPVAGHGELSLSARDLPNERFLDRWGSCANAVLQALSQEQDPMEPLELARALAQGSDSKLVAAKHAYLEALVRYYACPARSSQLDLSMQHAALEDVRGQAAHARELAEALGLRADAWQASRLEAWCTRASRSAYEQARQRSQSALAAVNERLDAEDRVYFSLNKNSARDEYVVTRLRRAADVPRSRVPVPWLARWLERRRCRRQALAAFESLATLTQWSVEKGLDVAPHAVQGQLDPTQAVAGHQVERWITIQLALRRSTHTRWRRPPNLAPALWPHEALVQYYVAPEASFILVAHQGHAWVRELPVTRVALDMAVKRLHEALQRENDARTRPGRDRPARIEAARAARDQAVAELSRLLCVDLMMAGLSDSVRTLFVVPHDVLSNVPFGVLRSEAGALIERAAISLLPCSRFLERAQHGAPMPAIRELLGVAVEDFAPRALARLANTVPEVELLADLFGERACVLHDPQATRARVMELARSVEWLHLATHGQFDLTEPHASRLHLASDGDSTPWLSVSDAARAAWGRLRGVVLSACTASVHVALPGQELVGFPAAFLHAGVRHVVAPLWRVDDHYARLFMAEWYESAKSQSPLQALAQVQRAWSASADLERSMPFRWATFVHHGC